MSFLRRPTPRARLACLALCASSLLACRQSGTVVTPLRFDRPRAIAFACFNTETGLFVQLRQCEGLEEVSTDTLGLTALVAQTARGEVAAVDLRTGRVLDSDPVVPGFTFHRVGIDPVAIVVPPDAPAVTYVANRGSRTVQWMPTADFRPDAAGLTASSGQVVLPLGAPSHLLLSEDGTMLFAPVPDESAIATIPILPDGSLGEPTLTTLSATIPAAVAAAATETFERICNSAGALREPTVVPPRSTDEFIGLPAAPTRAILDSVSGELWISDANLPVVHRLMIDALGVTELASLNVGAPISDLSLTPIVPAALGDTPESAPTRYLYGLDADEGDVMAVDALDTSATFGAVLPVNAGLDTPDRIHFSSRVRALAVMDATPGGSVCAIGSDEEAAAAPDTLRGVFLAVGLADGSARIVDVYDLDASCRGGSDCSSSLSASDVNVYVRRHEPRVGALLSLPVSLSTAPSFAFETIPGTLEDSGRESTHAGPGLQPLSACPEHMSPVWPTGAQDGGASGPVICASSDPWELAPERWTASWEGALPGNLPPGRLVSTLDGAEGPWMSLPGGGACVRGVLGAAEAATLEADDPLSGYGGDEVVVTAELPRETENLEDCAAFVSPTDGTSRAPVGFVILAASDDRLRLGAALGDYSFERVTGCFPDLVDFEVRSRSAYTVTGSSSGLLHRLTADADGRCMPDPSVAVDPTDPRTYRPNRAVALTRFDNGLVSFQIQHNDAVPAPSARAVLSLTLSQIPPGLGASMRALEAAGATGAVVDELVWSPTDLSLFGVDGHGDRLVQMRTDPFRVVRALR